MNRWKLYLRQHDENKCQIVERPDLPGIYLGQFQVDIEGPDKPEIPAGIIAESAYLRWKADLLDRGYKVSDRTAGHIFG